MFGSGARRVSNSRCSFVLHEKWGKALRSSSTSSEKPPSIAPRPSINIKSIRQNPELYSQTCLDRNYRDQAGHPQRIIQLFDQWSTLQKQARRLRERGNIIRTQLGKEDERAESRAPLLEEARGIKDALQTIRKDEKSLDTQIQSLAIELPNLTSDETPRGNDPKVLGYINEEIKDEITSADPSPRDHVTLGSDFNLLDFASAATTSGWGWYYLKNEGAILEQALIQYALHTAMKHGFSIVLPPSMVYSHIVAASGFRPRDQSGEQQVYSIQQSKPDIVKAHPPHSLAGTAEIPFAGMNANKTLSAESLPLCIVGSSRCYRAEAGARGLQTKGLYRVHEFTKVEMFAWTLAGGEQDVFEAMISVQREILQNLGLHCRILKMPSTDLGASASRKWDIEVYFPSRSGVDEGWGEVTSTSICTDYQTRRLNTRVRGAAAAGGGMAFPSTVNGTALAVPRVLAALLEYWYVAEEDVIRIPEVLSPWMHGVKRIGKKGR